MSSPIKAVGLVTLYFLFCFGIILTLKKLFLADYQIEFYALSVAVVSALIAAKVVVTLDHTRAGTRFDASRALVDRRVIQDAGLRCGGVRRPLRGEALPCLSGDRRARCGHDARCGRTGTET